MTNRFWHLANPDGTGTGNVVQTEMDYKLMESMYGDVSKEWINHTASRPVTHHCDPSNPVGWIEGEEVYQVRIRKCMDWLNAQKEIYDKWLTDGAKEDLRRIWIEPKREQPEEKPFHIDTVREMLNQYETEQISIGKLTELLNQAAEKFYKS